MNAVIGLQLSEIKCAFTTPHLPAISSGAHKKSIQQLLKVNCPFEGAKGCLIGYGDVRGKGSDVFSSILCRFPIMSKLQRQIGGILIA